MEQEIENWQRKAGRLRFKRLRSDPQVFELTRLVAQERRVAMTHLLRRSRGSGDAATARQLAIYLAHVVLGRSQDVVAHLFARDRTTVAHSVAAIENLRDDQSVETEIARIEAGFMQAAKGDEHAL